MLKRLAAIFLAVAVAAPAAAQTFKPGDAALIPKAEQALRAIGAMQADFTFQVQSRRNPGRIFVDRTGGKLRMEFDPPMGHLLIANGPRVDFIGGNGTVVNAATGSTPLALIFRRDPRLSGEAQVLEIATKGQSAYFAVGQTAKPRAGKVIIHFIRTEPVWTLHGWGLIDERGRYTKTTLSNQRYGVDFDPALFVAPREEMPGQDQ